jgi:hypothetical protein
MSLDVGDFISDGQDIENDNDGENLA